MIVGIVGFIGSGKDTVANMLCQNAEGKAVKHSFAANLKDVCSVIFGWPRALMEGDTENSRHFRETPDMFWSRKTGIPNFTPRLAMQVIGTDVMRNHFHESIWIDSLEYKIHKENADCVVISDARFTNELDLISKMGGKIIWVKRGPLPEWYDTAVSANKGNAVARKIMKTKYSDVHESEWNWAGHPVDFVIDNNGTYEDLQYSVCDIANEIKKNTKCSLKMV